MLSDVLGIVIAFVTVLLLLSMVVTGLVQATQSLLRMRSRNLQQGVASLLEKYSGGGQPKSEYRRKAAGVLNADSVATLEKVEYGDSRLRRMLGPKVSWAEPRALAEAIANTADTTLAPAGAATPPASAVSIVQQDVENMQPALKKRFAMFIRLWTIFWSFIVAAAFQVSTPELLSSFSSGETPTEAYVEASGDVLALGERAGLAVGRDDGYEDLAAAALDRLAERYPGHGAELAEAGTGGTTTADLVQNVRDVLTDAADRDEVLRDYASMLDDSIGAREQAAIAAGKSAGKQLAEFGIEFWKHGWAYYADSGTGVHWGAIFGVLVTAILMSFGAPFWFEQLRVLASLRDLRAPAPAPAPEQNKKP